MRNIAKKIAVFGMATLMFSSTVLAANPTFNFDMRPGEEKHITAPHTKRDNEANAYVTIEDGYSFVPGVDNVGFVVLKGTTGIMEATTWVKDISTHVTEKKIPYRSGQNIAGKKYRLKAKTFKYHTAIWGKWNS